MNRIRVIIADDYNLMRKSLAEYLQRFPDIEIVGEVAETRMIQNELGNLCPDVLLIDANLLGHRIFKYSKNIIEKYPHMHILVTSAFPRYDYIVSLLKVGVYGCILRSDSIDELVQGIRATAHQDEWHSSQTVGILIQSITGENFNELKLTAREIEVLSLIAIGCKNRDIAEELVISLQTVKNHIRNIYNKLGVGSRVEAVTYAIMQGLVSNNEQQFTLMKQ